MHNKVVYHAMKALHSFGFPVLRFNFRGAGLSEGQHDHGKGEVEDVRTALDWLDAEFHLPILFCGFSFGAATGLRAACPEQRVVGLISLGTPVSAEGRIYTYKFLANCTRPKLFLSGAQDQFGPEKNLRQMFAMAAEPKQLVLIEGAQHFFEGHLSEMQSAIQGWVRQFFKPGRQAEAS
jgi:alpha/beta superfamily hydrolase